MHKVTVANVIHSILQAHAVKENLKFVLKHSNLFILFSYALMAIFPKSRKKIKRQITKLTSYFGPKRKKNCPFNNRTMLSVYCNCTHAWFQGKGERINKESV